MSRPNAAHFNAFFRGHIFGNHDIFTARSYDDFVRRNDIDLDDAVTVCEGRRMIGALAFGIRDQRAWFGLIGVDPAYRRGGVGRSMFAQAIERVHARGVTSVELEVSQKNHATLAMCAAMGFHRAGELLVWARKPHRIRVKPPTMRTWSEEAVAGVADPPSCWQREPRSVARAKRSALIEVPGAYAFVRIDGEFANILDAGASNVAAAHRLLRELDTRAPHDTTLNNEASHSVLATALREAEWRTVERQHRLILSSRA
jgi:ribosomal protein S18 acetylase RimI-like enzyme